MIQDQNAAVVPGLQLRINGGSSSDAPSLTDINGEFDIPLSNGDYVITADALPPEKFRAFIKVTDKGLNAGYLKFTIDTDAIPCSRIDGKESPKIISTIAPKYPAAAKAVRAFGEVVVDLIIKQDGTVSSAKAVSGHPLLRSASLVAARGFKFASSDDPLERKIQIAFVFLLDEEIKPGLIRYECPYRINVLLPHSTIDITDTLSRPK